MRTAGEWDSYVETARERRRMKRPELARRIGVRESTVYRWEKDGVRPKDPDVVAKVAQVLGLDTDEALAAAGLRPAGQAHETPSEVSSPLDLEPDMAIINARLRDPAVSESEKILIRAQLRYLVELAERPADRPANR